MFPNPPSSSSPLDLTYVFVCVCVFHYICVYFFLYARVRIFCSAMYSRVCCLYIYIILHIFQQVYAHARTTGLSHLLASKRARARIPRVCSSYTIRGMGHGSMRAQCFQQFCEASATRCDGSNPAAHQPASQPARTIGSSTQHASTHSQLSPDNYNGQGDRLGAVDWGQIALLNRFTLTMISLYLGTG